MFDRQGDLPPSYSGAVVDASAGSRQPGQGPRPFDLRGLATYAW